MEIWLKQGKEKYRFAVLPPEYEVTSESNNTQVVVNSLGELKMYTTFVNTGIFQLRKKV